MTISANFRLKLASVDVRAAFLQFKVLDRDVYIEPPSNIKKPGILWKLKKPFYGVKDIFLNKLGFRTIDGD